MFNPLAAPAKKALSLRKDTVFRLMVVMTVLLGWLAGMGAGGLVGLENIYESWRLKQKSKVSIYLLADSKPQTIMQLTKEINSLRGVKKIERLSQNATLDILKPYFDGNSNFPLPVIIDVAVDDNLNRHKFDGKVLKLFPSAEIDDARSLLQSVSKGVRFAQAVVLIFAVVIIIIMALLVSLTVRAGLRGKIQSLAILQYVGATDSFLTALITRQVLKQSLLGWLLASLCAVASIGFVAYTWHDFTAYISPSLWIGTITMPFILVIVAVIAARMTAKSVIKRG